MTLFQTSIDQSEYRCCLELDCVMIKKKFFGEENFKLNKNQQYRAVCLFFLSSEYYVSYFGEMSYWLVMFPIN